MSERRLRTAESLSDALPDLVVLVRRDGIILGHFGGRGAAITPTEDPTGQHLASVWPEPLAQGIQQAVRRAIALRTTLDVVLTVAEEVYEVRTVAQRADRALCVIRTRAAGNPSEDTAAAEELSRPQFDRRGFLRRFHDSLARAAIQETPAALALLHVDGISDIARVVDARIAEQVLSTAILRLPHEVSSTEEQESNWYLGQLSADLLAMVIESSDRESIERCVSRVCSSLREPVHVGDAAFHVTPHCGVSILGQDGTSPKSLLEKARSAAAEARRANSAKIHFFTDTLKLRSLARLDVAREIRDAIASREIRLRYVGRYELATGRLVAMVGYLKWAHPLRGDLPAAEFLGVAETTGLATILSRALLDGLREDFAAMAPELHADTRISFGALRHHMLQEDFVDDIRRFIAEGSLPAARLELRISERTFASMDTSVYGLLHQLGVQIVVDEIGRGFTSLDRLARAPIWGLQLDRAWVTGLRIDPLSGKVCRAGIGAATALGLTPIATGVDDAPTRIALLELGCKHGSGDLYAEAAARFDTLIIRPASQIPP
jgi:EAL domain-containing protein (putative c-di-GMP-specific phosphodiesterase class I)/GGDEF domain-containing protein